MTDQASQEPRYTTLRDYLRVVRAYRVMIVVLVLIGGGLAWFFSHREDPVYGATASIAFKDETSEFPFFGLTPNQPVPATQLAAQNATTVTRPQVLSKASKRLGVKQLNASVFTSVDTNASLVDVNAQADDPQHAARVANAVAASAVATANAELQARFRRAARTLHRQTDNSSSKGVDAGTRSATVAELSRLDALGAFATAANVVEKAQPSATAISPRPTRSAVLGALGGLLAGLLLAFFRDSLDRRLRSAHEIRANYQFPVLGYVRDQAMGQTAYVKTGSKRRDGGGRVDIEGFRIMRRNLDFLNPDGGMRSILVTSAFPSEGKTTVSSSLAFSMAAGGKRTLLVECDFRRPVLASRLGFEPTPGLGDYLAGQAKPQEVLRTVEFSDPPLQNGAGPSEPDSGAPVHTLVCIPAGEATPNAAELLGSERLREFLDQVRHGYDVAIIDSSPLLPVADTLELLPHVDGVVVCAREFHTTRGQAQAAREALDHFPERPTALVVTGTKPRGDDYEGYAYNSAYSAPE